MKSFLESLADRLEKEFPEGLEDLCIVFPTQRAGLFFKKILAKRRQTAIWAPDVLSIENFFTSMGDSEVPDNLTLIFELYTISKKFFPEESFERYYYWGNLLLQDFDEVDRSMADAKQVFTNVRELKEIDLLFGLGDDEKEMLRVFWSAFWNQQEEPGSLKKEFLKTWAVLYEMYIDFRASLEKKKWAYAGMMYRNAADHPELYMHKTKHWKKIVFAGLYDLSQAEEKFCSHLAKEGKAVFVWDTDEYYLNNERMEAGRYFRSSTLYDTALPTSEHFKTGPKKNIEILGVSHPSSQAKAAGNILLDALRQKDFLPEETALILSDESLLLPVLHSIPDEVSKINVTMGFPFKESPLYVLFEMLHSLHKNKRKQDFYYRDVIRILDHPYIQNLRKDNKIIQALKQRLISGKWVYAPTKIIQGEERISSLTTLFRPVETSDEVYSYLLSILVLLKDSFKGKSENVGKMEAEYIFRFYTVLNRLDQLGKEYNPEFTAENTWRTLKEMLHSIRIPFAGEPVEGLQVMGFLESRALDFKNIILFSLNEGSLPSTMRANSFIPVAIRRAFGLQTYEHHDSRQAYYFYRLLQRAENVFLLYSTQVKSVSGGDKSRYLLQIKEELSKRHADQIELRERMANMLPIATTVDPIEVQKNEEIILALKKVKFSPSALSTYITCPLKFYLTRIAKIREDDEIEEDMDPSEFGNVFHKAMELIYQNVTSINKSTPKSLKPLIPEITFKAFQLESGSTNKKPYGRNLLFLNVIESLVEQVLNKDAESGPFSIFMMERFTGFSLEISPEYGSADFTGKMDRVDKMDGHYRIVDYKTGQVKGFKFSELNELFMNPEKQVMFQTYFYALMFVKNNPGSKVKMGIYPLKQIYDGIKEFPENGFITDAGLKDFEESIKNMILEIGNTSIPFKQTPEKARCSYCEFKSMCRRN